MLKNIFKVVASALSSANSYLATKARQAVSTNNPKTDLGKRFNSPEIATFEPAPSIIPGTNILSDPVPSATDCEPEPPIIPGTKTPFNPDSTTADRKSESTAIKREEVDSSGDISPKHESPAAKREEVVNSDGTTTITYYKYDDSRNRCVDYRMINNKAGNTISKEIHHDDGNIDKSYYDENTHHVRTEAVDSEGNIRDITYYKYVDNEIRVGDYEDYKELYDESGNIACIEYYNNYGDIKKKTVYKEDGSSVDMNALDAQGIKALVKEIHMMICHTDSWVSFQIQEVLLKSMFYK